MARAAARLLLGGCLGTLCWGCTEEQALVFNRLAGRDLLKLANAGIGNLSFETIGDCAAAGDGLKPCRSVPNFPVHMQGKDWKITVPYATGLDTFSMTNISLRCDPTSSATPAELGWFAELDGTIRDFGINVTAHVDFPKLERTTLERVANLTAHVVARGQPGGQMDLPSRASVLPEELKGALLLPDQQECEAQGRTPRRSLSWAEARAFGKGNPRICLYVHAFGLPQTLLVLYVLWGCWDNCYGEEDCPKPRSVFNWLFATLGPVLPLAVLGVRLLVLPFSRHEIFMTVIVWFLMAVVRLLIYVYWMGGSGWFSDHIFLMACILGMLHTEIAYAHDYVLDGYVWAVPPLLVSYFLVWRISEEAYVTASFYHSRLQSLLALLVGVPLFVSMAGLWVHWRPMCIKAPREPEAPSDAEAGAGAPRRAEEEDAHENGREAGAEDNGSPFAEDLPPLHVPSSNLATQRREGGAAVAEGPRRAASEYAGGAPKSEVPRRSASEHVGGTDKFVVHRTPSFGSDQAQAAPGPLPHGMLEPPQAFSLAGAASAPPPVDAGGVLATEILAPPSGAAAFGGGTWSPSSACGTNPFQDPAGSPRDTMAPAAAAATESGSARGSADFLAPAPEADPPSHQHEPSIAAAGAAVPPAGPDRRQAEEQERDSTPEWRPPTAKEQPKQPACCAFMPSFRRQPNASGDRSEEEGASGQRRARGRSFDGIKDF